MSKLPFDKSPKAPIAKKIKYQYNVHDEDILDDYFWMRLSDAQKEAKDKDNQTKDVLDYLNKENDYLKDVMKSTEPFQKNLYEEIVGRIKQNDESVPYTLKGYTYYSRFVEGEDYNLRCRKKNTDSAEEEIIVNGPELGKGKPYFALGHVSISDNQQILAYTVDYVSRREYDICFKDLDTGKSYDYHIPGTTGIVFWANDNRTVFYTKKDPVTLRSHRIYKHVLGSDPKLDELVFEEKDETFSCYVYKSRSGKYLVIHSRQTVSDEFRVLDADTPNGTWKVVQPRKRKLEYNLSHHGDNFYIITNHEAPNFRLMKTSIDSTSMDNWEEVIPHDKETFIEGAYAFKNHLIIFDRQRGLPQLLVMNMQTNEKHYIPFDDEAYDVWLKGNHDYNLDYLRFEYTSMNTPDTVYDYDLNSRERKVRKVLEVVDDTFDASNYETERLSALSRDGSTHIPISIVYKKGFKKDGNAPVLLYAYGSYGHSLDPSFITHRLSLLNRGFAFAIAHIRGGQEMGRQWYEDGKLLNKMNTFHDFIDCGQFLVNQKYTSEKHLYAQGGSAGGLLMGAIMNLKPELFNGVLAAVPFVDVIATMLDETIPLTTGEFDEWGNPKIKEYFDYIRTYSPIDNVERKAYPNTLISTGYWDSQVQYWEPAKWIAKLRDYRTDDNLLIMTCDMDVGHGGASGRFKRYKEIALKYAFLLGLEGIVE